MWYNKDYHAMHLKSTKKLLKIDKAYFEKYNVKQRSEVFMRTEKKDIINRLKRTEGQLRGVQRMIDEDSTCFDIITQLTAIRSSINSAMGVIIGNKITQVIENPSEDPKEQEERLNQAIQLIVKK